MITENTKANIKSEGLFEVQRAIRFELTPIKLHREINFQPLDLKDRRIRIMSNLERIEFLYNETYFNFASSLFYNIFKNEDNLILNETTNWEISNSIQFKFSGLDKCFRRDWFDKKESLIKYRINKAGQRQKTKNYITLHDGTEQDNFLKKYFIEWSENNHKLLLEINNIAFKSDSDLGRISDIGDIVQRIKSRNYLGILFLLIEGGHLRHKNDDEIILKITTNLIELKEYINLLEGLTRPSQSSGIPFEHLTLNYFARNKTIKDYAQGGIGENEIKQREKGLDVPYKWQAKDPSKNTKMKENERYIEKLLGISNLPIKQLYETMKKYKADQKTAFIEQLQTKTLYSELSHAREYVDNKGNLHPNFVNKLFTSIKGGEKTYDELLIITRKIEETINSEKRKELKMRRGKYFFGSETFPEYGKFCNIYKDIAMEYGRKRAEVLALKREKIESIKERGFCFLGKDESGDINLYSFPNTSSKNVYKTFTQTEIENEGVEYFLLHSITLRALEKQCFQKDSTFVKEHVNCFQKQYTRDTIQFCNNSQMSVTIFKSKKILIEENLLLPFLIEVVNLGTNLNIQYRSSDSLSIISNSQSIEEFEENIKKECYILQSYKMNSQKFSEIIDTNQGNVYKITSWDLIKDRNKPEQYTKWWYQFWSDENKTSKYPVRLNPEMLVSFISKEENLPTEKQEFRKGRNRYILTATLSHHADKKNIFSHFTDDQEREISLKKFNLDYNAQNNFNYIYSLDRGLRELVTLGMFKINENSMDKFEMPQTCPVFRITKAGLSKTRQVQKKKDGSISTHFLYKNPSLFIADNINNSDIFEKVSVVSCFGNLTCAKVIDGKIILNGDMNTIFSLYKTAAKRFIYEAITQGKTLPGEDKISYNSERNQYTFGVEKNDLPKTIFDVNENTKEILELIGRVELENELNEYIQIIKNFNPSTDAPIDISINKINHLKDAVCANIVGVIIKLQEFFPGWIAFEALEVNRTQGELDKDLTYLGNLIIEKLYMRLQLSSQVPPILKKFRSDIKKGIQHGRIIYVDQANTSKACPVCRKKLFGHGNPEFEKKMHHFSELNGYTYKKSKEDKMNDYINPDCDYNMETNPHDFNFIKNGDDLATYNIALKGLTIIGNK